MILIRWKNKGILILFYLGVCIFLSGALFGTLHTNYGGIFEKMTFPNAIAIAFIAAGIWTYLTCETYYRDKEGNKKRVDVEHELFSIKMKYWAYIYWGVALIMILYQLISPPTA